MHSIPLLATPEAVVVDGGHGTLYARDPASGNARGRHGRPAGPVARAVSELVAALSRRGVPWASCRCGAAGEAPDAHKRLDAGRAEHGDSIRVLHRLEPIGVAMAGPHIYDPYKD
jgi:tRNA-splicing ligase RtcB (3'-phosphate/5'-hydroxy nucleic acid ligase)